MISEEAQKKIDEAESNKKAEEEEGLTEAQKLLKTDPAKATDDKVLQRAKDVIEMLS